MLKKINKYDKLIFGFAVVVVIGLLSKAIHYIINYRMGGATINIPESILFALVVVAIILAGIANDIRIRGNENENVL